MYAIQNVKTGKFVYGTDFRCWPRRQRTSCDQMLTFSDLYTAQIEADHRRCGKDYKVVELKPIKIKRIFERDEQEKEDGR